MPLLAPSWLAVETLRAQNHGDAACLRPFFESLARKRVLCGPNRGGKTVAGAKEVLWLMGALEHPYKKRFNIARPLANQPIYVWVVCYSQRQSVAIQRTLFQLVPRHMLVTWDFNDSRGFLNGIMRLANGSVLEVKTVGQDSLGLASASVDVIWVDEPPPQEIYSELISRLLTTRGSLFITCTPIGRPVGWLKDLADSGEIEHHQFALTVENCPHLDKAQVDEQVKDILPNERPQRIFGEWEGVTPDRLFDQWSDDNELPASWTPKQFLKLAVGWDHGEGAGKEFCGLFVQTPREIVLIDEAYNKRPTSIDEDAIATVDMLARNGIPVNAVSLWIGDTNSAGKAAARVGSSVNDELAKLIVKEHNSRIDDPLLSLESIRIENADKSAGSVDFGLRLMNKAMGRHEFAIKANCVKSLEAVRHWKGSLAGDDKKLSHPADMMRYTLTKLLGDTVTYSYLRIRYAAG